MHLFPLLVVLLLYLYCIGVTHAKSGLCEVETGQSNIILDIEESRYSFVDQQTTPPELPIAGDPFTEIVLDLVFPKDRPIFLLNGKRLQLLQPLDRDAESLSHIVFQLTCMVKSTNKKRTIPVIVRVSDVNDNAPEFINAPYETTVPELTPVGTTIFQGILAKDADAGVNGLVEYFLVKGDGKGIGPDSGVGKTRITSDDGYGYFSVNLPHQGQVTVNRTLDYEKTQRYLLTIVASDRARNSSERFSATTTLTVHIQDQDDLDPSFIYQGCDLLEGACINPEYKATVSSGVLSGVMSILPEKIQAVDMDTLAAQIRYSILRGTPTTWVNHFEINPTTGAIRQIRAVDTAQAKRFDLIIKAQEESEGKRFATAKLAIVVKPVDANAPKINATSTEGFVDENAPIGTNVLDANGKPLKLEITDADLGLDDPHPNYTFELTTPFFAIDKNGILVVHEENLDRDPPSPGKFRFQVVAREYPGTAASAPLSFAVNLRDVNDNAPKLPQLQPISVPAGETRRIVTKVEAPDNDEGVNSIVTYSIYHVSNNGANKFTIDPKTGVIGKTEESTGLLSAGQQYSITVQAMDIGGLYSQSIVEVSVAPGPNTRPPVFTRPVWEIQVSEGAEINSTVATITAKDPENDPVTFSITSGNDLRQFAIGSMTGLISVIRKLDREDLTRYQLLIKAEDSGKLSSTATVNIKVTDINDKNPEFDVSSAPYIFHIKEGQGNISIGRVHATDTDEGVNALVSYSLPDDIPFTINKQTGKIFSKITLDYETSREYRFVVTARDGAQDPRQATASVTVSVEDVPDEMPIFRKSLYEVSVSENLPNHPVVKVVADDPDTIKEVTYVIRQGPTELFTIDSHTGELRTVKGLDFEKEQQHELVIGTLENPEKGPGTTTRVIVSVLDHNDIPPGFTISPGPEGVLLDDSAAIGDIVTELKATDSDGTQPFNIVRYEIVGRGDALRYFSIDLDNGVVRVRDDLRKEAATEYIIDVKAFDLGQPQLSTVISIPVHVTHAVTAATSVGLGFADDVFSVDIKEGAYAGTLLKSLKVVNNQAHANFVSFHCVIDEGNENGMFIVNVTENMACALYLNTATLDFEHQKEHIIKITLKSNQSLVDQYKLKATVKINVLDENDNVPEFIFPEPDVHKFYAVINKDASWDSVVTQIQAKDLDSDQFGKIQYKLINTESTVGFFNIDPNSGVVTTKKILTDVDDDTLPIRMEVEIRDNPNAETEFHMATAPFVVNLLTPEHRMSISFVDAAPESIKGREALIVGLLREQTGLPVAVERLTAHEYLGPNDTIECDSRKADMWFYVLNPDTDLILKRNDPQIERSILEPGAQSNITFLVSALLHTNAESIQGPVSLPPKTRITMVKAAAASGELFPYALIAIGVVILVLGTGGVIFICMSWNRYKNYKHKMQHYTAPSSPMRYDSHMSGTLASSAPVDADLTEYETQVLNMSVPQDDGDSYADLQLDFSSKNHTFTLDNVSYITKDSALLRQHSPTSTPRTDDINPLSYMTDKRLDTFGRKRLDTFQKKTIPDVPATMTRNNLKLDCNNTSDGLNSKCDKNNSNLLNTLNKSKNRNPAAFENHNELPNVNLAFQRSEEDTANSSATNENVTFGKVRDYSHLGFSYLGDRSPIETTTEL